MVGTHPDSIFQRSPILHSSVPPGRKVTRQLTFETEEGRSKKMAPSTPIGAKSTSVNIIDIIDSDDEPDISTQNLAPDRSGRGKISLSTCFAAEKGKCSDSNYAQNNEENLDFGEDFSFSSTPKRKRTCNVIISESESDDEDDNMPICKLKRKRMHTQEVSSDQVRPDFNSSLTATNSEVDNNTNAVMTRRRLQSLRNCVSKSQDDKTSSCKPHKVKHEQSIPTNDDGDDDESEDDLSYSEGGNMSDFIVDDSDVSNCEDTSSKSQDGSNGDVDSDSSNSQDLQDSNKDSDSQDESDGDMDFGKILSKIQRSKNNKMKWNFEADMLAAFGKDPELCMKAVCALYRQQTSEEQISKGTLCYNGRGFSKFDAHR